MSQYFRGDVVLVSLQMQGKGVRKVRPAVVVRSGDRGELVVSPVSSRPSFDSPSEPLALDDFSEGGLDIFGESYVITAGLCRVHAWDIIGKKGELRKEAMERLFPEKK
jgi:mRNA-degrading endonuclease toxin of MazEF toxin-antitoxin module